jgi:hypothetical protein
MEINKLSFHHTFDVILPNNIIIKSSHVILSLLYQQKYLEYYTNNSIYGTLKKSIFNIPVGTPVKMIIINENIINIYFILNSIFYSIPIEFIEEFIE